ncbi:hypothetical protein LC653_14340 [Nostoc sp. CHAB 5784]|uniref:Uncharacterized protein n=1 Tax=Nostoc favosum CHAB5714 TaxID=2780399 RepID=A0ABS8ID83_9NOSO|nr:MULTISPECIES: hypothetical protein [Nostoc]MCC5601841.1 hypothetical protein [Nostoc favosum CHAB5714]MCC5665062.1 hypothetical protein [Nostoc mirabile CHAB5784]
MSNTNHLNLLKPATAALLIPLYILTTCITSYAEIPETAVINYASDPGVRLLLGATDSGKALAGQRMQKYKDAIGIPASKKSLSRLSLRNQIDSQIGGLVQAGPASVTSAYTFPCKVSGSVLYGWRQRSSSCSDRLWVVPVGSQLHSSKVPPSGSKNTYSTTASKNLLQAQASTDLVRYYCSTVANPKMGQWMTSTGSLSPEAACQEATQKCEASTGGKCLVASLGEWNVNDPDLVVSMQCASNKTTEISALTRKGNGSVIDKLLSEIEQMSLFVNAINCVPSIYHPNELIVSPMKDELTLIQTNNVNGNLEINVLVGTVNIVSVKRPTGFKVPKGFSYRLSEGNLTRIDCDNILQSQPVQEFLNTANWPQEAAEQLQGYRSGFCKSPDRPTRPTRTGPVIIISPGGGGGGGGRQTTPSANE